MKNIICIFLFFFLFFILSSYQSGQEKLNFITLVGNEGSGSACAFTNGTSCSESSLFASVAIYIVSG